MKSNTRIFNHLIIIIVLIISSALYFGYKAFTSDNARQEYDFHANEKQFDMQSFKASLPESYSSLVSMGNDLMDRQEYITAIECYSKALEIDSTAIDVRVDMGTCLFNLRQYDLALTAFNNALEINPKHQTAKYNMGIVYLTVGDTVQAIECWQSLQADNPSPELINRLDELIGSMGGD